MQIGEVSSQVQGLHRLLYDNLMSTQPSVCDYDNFYPLKLERLPPLLGWRVEYQAWAALPHPAADIHGQADFNDHLIVIATEDGQGAPISKESQRFALAHEIGHVVLRHDLRLPTRETGGRFGRLVPVGDDRRLRDEHAGVRGRDPELEFEADRFARRLLVPDRALKHFVKKTFGADRLTAGNLAESFAGRRESLPKLALLLAADGEMSLASIFGAPPSCVADRLAELGLVYA